MKHSPNEHVSWECREPCTPPGWDANPGHRAFPAPAAACGLPSPFGCMLAPAAAKAGAPVQPSCATGPWRAAAACGWPAERTWAAHGRPMRSLFKSHYARPRCCPLKLQSDSVLIDKVDAAQPAWLPLCAPEGGMGACLRTHLPHGKSWPRTTRTGRSGASGPCLILTVLWPRSAAPALRRAASLPLACTEVDITLSTDRDAPAPVVSAPHALQPLRTSRSAPLARIRCPPRLPVSALPPLQLQAPMPMTPITPRVAPPSSLGRSGSLPLFPLRGSACLPPPAPRRAAAAPAAPNQARRGGAMDDVLNDLLGSAVARLMAASEARPMLARRAHSVPAASMVDDCELWAGGLGV